MSLHTAAMLSDLCCILGFSMISGESGSSPAEVIRGKLACEIWVARMEKGLGPFPLK